MSPTRWISGARTAPPGSPPMSSAMFSRFDQQVVALTVVTNVANTWFTALALADRLAVAQRNLADAEQTLAVIRGRLDAGTASALDVAQQEALVAGERATIPNLRNQLEQELIGLGILVGRPPEAITVRPGSLNNLALPPVAPGLPSSRAAAPPRRGRGRGPAGRGELRHQGGARRVLSVDPAHRVVRLLQRRVEHAVHARRDDRLARRRIDPAAVRRRHCCAASWSRPKGATTSCWPTTARRWCRPSPTSRTR